MAAHELFQKHSALALVHRNDNNHSGRKSSLGKLSMAKCRIATVSRKAAYCVRQHVEKIRQFLVFCDIPAAGEQGCSAERSLRQDAE